MTTKKQIDGLLRRLLERNPDLAQSGRFVVLKPLQRVIRSISIDATSRADRPQFLWSFSDFTPAEERLAIGPRQGCRMPS
jgi:hypothetical protein